MTDSKEIFVKPPIPEEILDANPEKRQLQKDLIVRLYAYFETVFEVLNVTHPSCHAPVIVWMTEDVNNPENLFQGPIPLLFELSPDLVQYDYREGNDERILDRNTNELTIDPQKTLNLPTDRLRTLIENIDKRMQEIADEQQRTKIVETLEKWVEAVGFNESLVVKESLQPLNFPQALKDFHSRYSEKLSEYQATTS